MTPAAALTDVRHVPYWLDGPAPEASPVLVGPTSADLAVVGAGYTGLWAALQAKEADPGRDVLLLEARTAGWAASGRNGGFCSASLTHGLHNGMDRFPGEMTTLERLGRENLDGIEKAVADHGIDCSWERTGELTVATEPWQVADLRELPGLASSVGGELDWLRPAEVRARVDSPTYLGGVLDRDGVAMLHPARLASGLREACLRLGVRVHENTPVGSLRRGDQGVELRTPYAEVRTGRVLLATNAGSRQRRLPRRSARSLAADPRPSRPGLRLVNPTKPVIMQLWGSWSSRSPKLHDHRDEGGGG